MGPCRKCALRRVWMWCLVMLVVETAVWGQDSLGKNEQSKDPVKYVKCWECMNYDDKGTFHDQCPMDGNVDPKRAYLGNCTGRCFTHTDDLNKRLVMRGCTASQYGLPDPLPADGCYPWYSEIWCVCATDGCNGVKLGTPKSDKEFDAHIDYTKPKTTGDNAAPALTSCHTYLLLTCFVCISWLWTRL